MEKPRYTTQRKGGWYWEPTKAMRATGLVAQALGKDRAEAFRKAEELNATWDEMRRAEERIDEGIFTVGRLLKSFEKDPAYYGALAPRTKQEVDYAFKVVHEIFGDVPVKSLRRKHCRAFYNQLRLETTDRMESEALRVIAHELLNHPKSNVTVDWEHRENASKDAGAGEAHPS